MGKRIVVTTALVGAIVCALAAPAFAHVSIDPSSAPQGSTVKLAFVVPNEEPTAKVTEVQIAFPAPPQTPISTVSVEAKPGWSVKVTTQKLATPITTDDGSISDIVRLIDWKAKTPADGIAPAQFGEFVINADGLPANENEVVFKAIQTYSDGTVVRWIDPVTAGVRRPNTRRPSSSSRLPRARQHRRPSPRDQLPDRVEPPSWRPPRRTTARVRSRSLASCSARSR